MMTYCVQRTTNQAIFLLVISMLLNPTPNVEAQCCKHSIMIIIIIKC